MEPSFRSQRHEGGRRERLSAAAMADSGNPSEGSGDGKGKPQSRASGSQSLYLRFIERFASLCHSAGSSSDESDSAAPARQRLARSSTGSWISGRLGRSKKGSDQVKQYPIPFQICGEISKLSCRQAPRTGHVARVPARRRPVIQPRSSSADRYYSRALIHAQTPQSVVSATTMHRELFMRSITRKGCVFLLFFFVPPLRVQTASPVRKCAVHTSSTQRFCNPASVGSQPAHNREPTRLAV